LTGNFARILENIWHEKCDIFSAGVIFFILLSGQVPVPGSTIEEILNKNKKCNIDLECP